MSTYLTGTVDEELRKEFFYFIDDGDLAALRYKEWKTLFLEQAATGYDVWQKTFNSVKGTLYF